jgi:hemoglobin
MATHDILGEADIRLLVDSFYDKVRKDKLLSPIFDQIIGDNWEHHLPVMYTFWNNVIFHQGGYKGNPMLVHQRIHQIFPLKKPAFERWLNLWKATVQELFVGPQADNVIQRAESIAGIMQQKLA